MSHSFTWNEQDLKLVLEAGPVTTSTSSLFVTVDYLRHRVISKNNKKSKNQNLYTPKKCVQEQTQTQSSSTLLLVYVLIKLCDNLISHLIFVLMMNKDVKKTIFILCMCFFTLYLIDFEDETRK